MAKGFGLPVILLVLAFPASAGAEWVVSGYLGAAFTQNSYLKIHQPALGNDLTFHDVSYRGDSFNSPLYYGYRAGYFFGPHIGFEAEFIHLKVYAEVDREVRVDGTLEGAPVQATIPMDTIVQRFSISHGVNLLLGDFVYRWNFFREPGRLPGRLILSGRAGFGGTIPHPESEILGVFNEHYQGGRWAFQAAAGAEVRLWSGLYGLGEYKYTRTRQRVEIHAGHAETLLNTHHVVFGLSWHF